MIHTFDIVFSSLLVQQRTYISYNEPLRLNLRTGRMHIRCFGPQPFFCMAAQVNCRQQVLVIVFDLVFFYCCPPSFFIFSWDSELIPPTMPGNWIFIVFSLTVFSPFAAAGSCRFYLFVLIHSSTT